MVRETGYGNFGIDVDIYFKGIDSEDPAKKTHLQHTICLRPSLEVLSSRKKDNLKRESTFSQRKLITISHKDPSVIKRLVKGKQKVLQI